MNENLGKDNGIKILHYGVVIDNNDPNESNLIKVRVNGVDDNRVDNELPLCYPLLPKNITMMPKVGEMVIIIFGDTDSAVEDRFYISILTPHYSKMEYSDVLTAKVGLNSSKIPNKQISSRSIPESLGVFPNGEDLTIQGRKNSEIRFKNSSLLVRVGKDGEEKVQNIPILNTSNQTFIQLKHNISLFNTKTNVGMVNIVSDKINLLTHENGSPRFNVNGGDEPISDSELIRILTEAHPLAFGDKLIEYLLLLRDVVINHVHAYNGLKSINVNGEDSIEKLLGYDLNQLLSKNIKIN